MVKAFRILLTHAHTNVSRINRRRVEFAKRTSCYKSRLTRSIRTVLHDNVVSHSIQARILLPAWQTTSVQGKPVTACSQAFLALLRRWQKSFTSDNAEAKIGSRSSPGLEVWVRARNAYLAQPLNNLIVSRYKLALTLTVVQWSVRIGGPSALRGRSPFQHSTDLLPTTSPTSKSAVQQCSLDISRYSISLQELCSVQEVRYCTREFHCKQFLGIYCGVLLLYVYR